MNLWQAMAMVNSYPVFIRKERLFGWKLLSQFIKLTDAGINAEMDSVNQAYLK